MIKWSIVQEDIMIINMNVLTEECQNMRGKIDRT